MTHKNFNPEAHFFKTALANVCIAKGLIQRFLPEALRAALDMRTLKRLPHHFVEKDFETALSDSIYSVKMNHRKAYICFIYVEKSIPDRLLPALILCYTLHVQEQYHKQHPQQKRPFIYALVACNGQRQFQNTIDVDIHDYIHVSREFADALSPGPIQLIDINAVDRFVKCYHSTDCSQTKAFPVIKKSRRDTYVLLHHGTLKRRM